MIVTLYAEAAMAHRVRRAGWGAVVSKDTTKLTMGGSVDRHRGLITVAELEAINAAAHRAFLKRGDTLVIATRSTAAMAVLRWVFKDAPYSGSLTVQPPKSLSRSLQDAECIYELSDLVEDIGVSVQLQYVGDNPCSRAAVAIARLEVAAEKAAARQ